MSTKDKVPHSVASNVSEGQTLVREILRQKHASEIRFNSRDGYFVPEKEIGKLESRLIELLKTGSSSVEPNTLIKMNREIEELRRKDAESQLRLQSLNGEVAKKNGDIAELHKSITAKEALFARSEADYKANNIALTASVNKAKTELETFKGTAKSGFLNKSAEDKEKYESTLNQLRGNLTAAHKALDIERNLRTTEKVSIDKLKDAVAALETEKARANAHAKRLKENSYAAVIKAGPNEQSILLNEGALLKMLGEKSVAFLREGDVVMSRIGDKAYNLMLATKNSSSQKVRGLYPLVEKVFQWLRSHTRVMGRKVAKFVELIYQDIICLRVNTVEHYAAVLDELRLDISLDIEKYKTKHQKEMPKSEKAFKFSAGFVRRFLLGTRKNQTWLGKARVYVVASYHKVKKGIRPTVKSFWDNTKEFLSSFGSYFHFPSEKAKGKRVVTDYQVEVETVYDAADDEILLRDLQHVDPEPIPSSS